MFTRNQHTGPVRRVVQPKFIQPNKAVSKGLHYQQPEAVVNSSAAATDPVMAAAVAASGAPKTVALSYDEDDK